MLDALIFFRHNIAGLLYPLFSKISCGSNKCLQILSLRFFLTFCILFILQGCFFIPDRIKEINTQLGQTEGQSPNPVFEPVSEFTPPPTRG